MKRWGMRVLIALVGTLGVAVAVLVAMGLRQDAGVSRAATEIDASREQVWPWIEEPDRFRQWVSLVTAVQVVNPDVKGAGRQTVVLMTEKRSPEPVRIESVWTVYEPPDRFAADVTFPGLFTGSQAYELADTANGRTRVQMVSRIRYTSWFIRVLEPVLTPISTRKLEQDLKTLKQLVERSTAQ